jgi:hypothetical protein
MTRVASIVTAVATVVAWRSVSLKAIGVERILDWVAFVQGPGGDGGLHFVVAPRLTYWTSNP